MNFNPKLDTVRTIIVQSTDVNSPFDFDAEILMYEANSKYCYLRLKDVLIEETSNQAVPQAARNRIFFVKSSMGQKVYNTNKNRDFLGCFSVNKNTSQIGELNSYYKTAENPLLELSSMPKGTYNFKVVDKDDLVINSSNGNGSIVATKCVLIFEVFFYR